MTLSSDLSYKYAVGKMAEIMIASNEMIFNIQEKVYDASRHVVSMDDVPAVCTSSSTCFGYQTNTKNGKTPMNRSTSLPIPPESKHVKDPNLNKLYKKLIDLEGVGRSEWLKVFMHMSSYVRVTRPVARGDWDEPKKFVQRQTLTLDGPFPGISDDLMVSNYGKPNVTSLGKPKGRKSSICSDCDCPPKTVEKKNSGGYRKLEFERESPVTTPSLFRKQPISENRSYCGCMKIVPRSTKLLKTGEKRLLEKVRAN